MRERTIFCIDLKSFYASVECTLRGLNPLTTPLVVADESRGGGSIVLAVTPYLRSLGMPSRLRVFEIDPNYQVIFAKPRMKTYIDYSIKVIDTYLDFVSDEDLFIYSIDEAFLDVTTYLSYYQMTPYQLAKTILKALFDRLGLYATCGIGPNMLIAKLALDLESKTNKDYIAQWQYDDIQHKLWPITPLSKMWGIGSRMESNLNKLGIYSIGELAKYDKNKLKKLFGIKGLELYHHANGRDQSLIQNQDQLKIINQSYSVGQVLFSDYNYHTAKLIIQEMCEDITRRLRLNKKTCWTVSLSIGYSKGVGGFSRQMRLDNKTNSESRLFKAFMMLYERFIEDYPIRQIHLGVSSLSNISHYQMSLFEDYQAEQIKYELDLSVDYIKDKYGKNAIDKASSLYKHSTKKHRNTTVGGHHG